MRLRDKLEWLAKINKDLAVEFIRDCDVISQET